MIDLLAIGDRVVAQAKPREQIEAVMVLQRETEARVYNAEIESFSAAESHGVGIRIIVDGRQGFAYAATLDESIIAETLQEARDNASFGTPDEFLGLAEPDGVPVADLNIFDASYSDFPVADKIAMAMELERATLAADPRVCGIESAEYVDGLSEGAVVTTSGIRTTHRETSAYLSVYSLAAAAGETQTGFGFSVGRHPSELDPARAASDAAERATRLLGATKPSSGRLTVVLDPFVTAQFLEIIGSTLSGESVLKGRSLFADRVGQEVGSSLVTLIDDPTDAAAFTATEVDGEGLATRRNALIIDGILQGFVHNSYTARRAGTSSTGSAVRGFSSTPGVGVQAVSLAPGTQSQAELIATIDDGFLVQGVSGLHSGVNPVSGDFSTGAEGLRIRNGVVSEPIREVTIASTIQKMLHDIVAVGNDLEWLPMSAAGVSLVITDVTMSGS